MIRKIHGALPHLLFLVLVFLILQPSVEGTKSYTAFLIIVIAVEAALLANWKKKAAIDIGIICICGADSLGVHYCQGGSQRCHALSGTGKCIQHFCNGL